MASEPNLALSDAANFFDAGLTALGLVTALVTTILRGRLDTENSTRDLLAFKEGQQLKTVTVTDGSDPSQTHSLSKALLVVEEKAVIWAHELYSYYGATSGKEIDLVPGRWLHPDNYPPGATVEIRCKCPATKCKCLLWKREAMVTEHLVTIAKGVIFKLNDELDAVICAGCRHHNCHEFSNAVYRLDVNTGIATVGSRVDPIEEADVFMRSIADLYVEEEGNSGLVMIEPSNEDSVEWATTISEASATKDAEERGNENPFTVSYSKALEGQETGTSTGREEYADSSWWLSRLSAMAIAGTLSLVFRTDAFSSVLLARRALRGYITDRTGTKLPLQAFCSVAQSYSGGRRRPMVVLKPKRSLIMRLPHRLLSLGAMLEGVVLVLWILAVWMTPWFHPVGSSYLEGQRMWANVICAVVAIVASAMNAVYYKQAGNEERRRRWAAVGVACGVADAGVVSLTVIEGLIRRLQNSNGVATAMFRTMMMGGAVLQWILGVQLMGSLTASFRGASNRRLVPYAFTFLRLLALVVGAGRWA